MSDFIDEETAAQGAEAVPDEIASMFDLKQKKKKKKPKKTEGNSEGNEGKIVEENTGKINDENVKSDENVVTVSQEFILDPAVYSYGDLLQRTVDFLHQHNPEYTEKRRHTMKPPQLMRGNFSPFS